MTSVPEPAEGPADLSRLLARTLLFKRLPAELLSSLVSRSAVRTMRAGEILFQQGDAGTTMLVVLAGQVRVALPSREGREQVLRVLQAGDVLGELALLDGRSRSADAVAETNGRLLVVARREMMEAIRSEPELAVAILTILTARLRTTSQLLESMVFHDAGGRLATILLMLVDSQPGRRLDITQEALGARIAARRETVNRKLREWQTEGLICLKPGRIIVLDPIGLRRHAPAADPLHDDTL